MGFLTFQNIKLIVMLACICNVYLASCIVIPTASKTSIQTHPTTTIQGSPTPFSLLKRDIGDYQDNLDLYQNWASMCRGGGDKKNVAMIADQSDGTIGPENSLSVNNLWATVTQTVNCGGGHAITVTETVTASSSSKPTSTTNPSGNSCTGSCWSDYLWRK